MTGLRMKYFVLKPSGSDAYARASRAAMLSYASCIEEVDPQLAAELRDWLASVAAGAAEVGGGQDYKRGYDDAEQLLKNRHRAETHQLQRMIAALTSKLAAVRAALGDEDDD